MKRVNEVLVNSNGLQLEEWKQQLVNREVIPFLQRRLDDAEKKKEENIFVDFNDTEILQWFLYRREHLNEKHSKSQRTLKEYQRELTLFIEQLLTYSTEIDVDIEFIQNSSLFKSLSPRHIRRYQEWLAERSPYVKKNGSYSSSTLARKTTILRNFLLYMYEVKYITEPLHTGLLKATVKMADRPNRDLGPSEVMQLLDYFRKKQHPIVFAIIHVLTTTGIRNEEFCRLKVKDVKSDSISGGYYLDILGKGNKERQVPLKEKTFNSISMFRYVRGLDTLDAADPDLPLFTTNTRKSYTPSYLAQYLTKEINKTDLPFVSKHPSNLSPHLFRHAFAIISYKSGSDVYEVMRSLGHEKIETTMIYLQKIFEKEEHAIHKWNRDVFGDYI